MSRLPRALLVTLAVLVVLGSGLAARILEHRALALRASWPSTEERVSLPPARLARVLAAGYNELAADLAWARTLIYYGESLDRRGSFVDVSPLLASVNALDPWFHRPYLWGGHALTFRSGETTQADFRASAQLLERAQEYFPQDWELTWLLGLRYSYDLKTDDPSAQRDYRERGAGLLERAMRMPGAPADLPTQVASLRTRLGQKDRALRDLREMILTTEDEAARAKLEARFAELASQDMASALADETKRFQVAWRRELPYAPDSMYVILGDRPGSAIDLEAILARADVNVAETSATEVPVDGAP